MSLDEKHLVITEEQYEQLKNKTLYINSPYDLRIINYSTMLFIKKQQFFDVIADKVEQDLDWLSFLKDELEQLNDTSLFYYLNTEMRNECEELPLTLDEWLEYEEDEYIIRKIEEEHIGDIKFYILIFVRYW